MNEWNDNFFVLRERFNSTPFFMIETHSMTTMMRQRASEEVEALVNFSSARLPLFKYKINFKSLNEQQSIKCCISWESVRGGHDLNSTIYKKDTFFFLFFASLFACHWRINYKLVWELVQLKKFFLMEFINIPFWKDTFRLYKIHPATFT